MKIKKPILLFIIILASCKKTDAPIDCYQCFFANMIESSMSIDYDSINKKEIQHDDLILNEKYYSNYIVCNTQEEVNNFYLNTNLKIDKVEKERYLDMDEENKSRCYFFVQIPKGYKAYKRNNIQQENKYNEIVLITTNFYYYLSNPKLSYCYVDIRKDETINENYVYSFFYEYDKFYSSVISDNNIRIIYNLSN